ncbi:GGDEF domain-containing protein [Vibrio sp. HENC-03]|uniref:GGDEF domain-containing protein n=1 Tax=Vibrio sp. HENC-03 TaxID=992012 RepID=UPI00028F19A0|nr:GGDEF domain-containing protein [Vibrio sp. HENC-03]EKM22583.1 diguanylate cyclase domain protein [Vibrio sp. HENC-03]
MPYPQKFDTPVAQLFDEQSRGTVLKVLMLVTLATFVPLGIKNLIIGETFLGVVLLTFQLSFIIELAALFILGESKIGYRIPLFLLWLSVVLSVHIFGIIATYWVFPVIVALVFIIPTKDALVTNGWIIVGCTISAWHQLEWNVTLRFVLAVICCAIVAHVAVHKILELQDKLTFLSTRDSMTGALNRGQLEAFLHRALDDKRLGKASTIAVIDIDHFKQVNDLYGHDVGDEVINQTVTILNDYSREYDLVFRLGGDEFLLLFEGLSEQTAHFMMSSISDKVRSKHFARHAHVSLSVGVAECLLEGDTPDLWLKRADIALYDAKQNGRDQVVVASKATVEPEVLDWQNEVQQGHLL